ncbi:hypothetical protein [Leptospira santarosai]|uniref:hypothetical protein n=1 Tax=Leptospira santarosai TaxID=28183 RepID=UPI0005182602
MNLRNENIDHFRTGGLFEYNFTLYCLYNGRFIVQVVRPSLIFYCGFLRPYPFKTLKKIIRGEWGRRFDPNE